MDWTNGTTSSRRSIGVRSFPRQREHIQGFSSSLKPTGTWSGNSSNRDLTSATTRNSTIAWSMAMQRISGFTSVLISRIRASFFASSRITTSHARLQPFPSQSSGRSL